MVVEIYTDGGLQREPGARRMGRGADLPWPGEGDLWGEAATTNNRMELMAAIRALETLTRPTTVHLYTDSVYVRSGIMTWLAAWKRNGWKTAAKQPVKNADLWQRLEEAAAPHQVEWRWVKGHNGDAGNERADALANRGLIEAGRR